MFQYDESTQGRYTTRHCYHSYYSSCPTPGRIREVVQESHTFFFPSSLSHILLVAHTPDPCKLGSRQVRNRTGLKEGGYHRNENPPPANKPGRGGDCGHLTNRHPRVFYTYEKNIRPGAKTDSKAGLPSIPSAFHDGSLGNTARTVFVTQQTGTAFVVSPQVENINPCQLSSLRTCYPFVLGASNVQEFGNTVLDVVSHLPRAASNLHARPVRKAPPCGRRSLFLSSSLYPSLYPSRRGVCLINTGERYAVYLPSGLIINLFNFQLSPQKTAFSYGSLTLILSLLFLLSPRPSPTLLLPQ